MKQLSYGVFLLTLTACAQSKENKTAQAEETAPAQGALMGDPELQTESPQGSQGAAVKTPSQNTVPREFLVAFQDDKAAEGRAEMFARHDVEEVEKVGSTATYLVRSSADVDSKTLIKKMESEKGVRYVEPNIRYRLFPAKKQ